MQVKSTNHHFYKTKAQFFKAIFLLQDLLDPTQTFLTSKEKIEIWVDFTIKSSTLNHLA
jgi:hypothetical protein